MKLDKIKNDKPPQILGITPDDKIKNEHSSLEYLWARVVKFEMVLDEFIKLKKEFDDYKQKLDRLHITLETDEITIGEIDTIGSFRIIGVGDILYFQRRISLTGTEEQQWYTMSRMG